MKNYCETILAAIKKSKNELDLSELISRSIRDAESAGRNRQIYVIEMIVLLRTAEISAITPQECELLNHAMDIFRLHLQ